jgi:hypothetical protein
MLNVYRRAHSERPAAHEPLQRRILALCFGLCAYPIDPGSFPGLSEAPVGEGRAESSQQKVNTSTAIKCVM